MARRCLAKDPELRYPTPGELAEVQREIEQIRVERERLKLERERLLMGDLAGRAAAVPDPVKYGSLFAADVRAASAASSAS